MREGALWSDIVATVMRWLGGMLPAVVIGAIAGVIIGWSDLLYRALNPVIDFLRSVPITAAFPAFLLFWGVGDAGKIAMAFAASVFIVVIHGVHGVRSTSAVRILMARSFGASAHQLFLRVLVLSALPQILLGGRTALSLSLIVTVVAEMLVGANHGLGQRIFMSYQLHQLTDLYALIFISGILGFGANAVWLWGERRLVRWS